MAENADQQASAAEIPQDGTLESAPRPATELEPVAAPPAPPTQPRIVFVETPAPPRKQGNRLIGGVVALLGGGVFAAGYSIAMLLVLALTPARLVGLVDANGIGVAYALFSASAFFWVPVLFFTLGFVVLALILNRAGWWLYVLFSVAVSAFTYFASIGTLLLLDRLVFMTPNQAQAAFWDLALDPRVIVAALVAREVSMWMGLAIAARGRRIRVKNAERRAAFEQELAATRSERERAAAAGL